MTKKTKTLGMIALVLLTGVSVLAGSNAFASAAVSEKEGPHMMPMMDETHFQEMRAIYVENSDYASFQKAMEAYHEKEKALQDKITRTVENIDNGVKMTMTSDDAAAIKLIQSRESNREGKGPKDENIQRTVEQISNGVVVTMTSTDANTVTNLQNPKEQGKNKGKMEPPRGECGGADEKTTGVNNNQ